jgi:cytochrome c553
MKHTLKLRNLGVAVWFASLALAAGAQAVEESKLPPPAQKPGLTFEKDIKTIFAATCTQCHGMEKQKSGVRLDSLDAVLKSKKGRAIIPGKSAESQVVISAARASNNPDENMPPKGKGEPLTKEQVGMIRAWIDQGAK